MKRIIHLIAAARPNFMKVAPLWHALSTETWCRPVLVHTGQHYDLEMSGQFLNEFGLPEPDIGLGVGSGSHARQTAATMIAYEKVCLRERPDWVVVVGDVNATLACALVAKKLLLPLAHLEAGLRSGDRTMPEEINRLATDAIADLLWTPSPDADANLRAEGVPAERIERVGNIMIDSFEMMRVPIEAACVAQEQGLTQGRYGVVTLHRPANVDDPAVAKKIVETLIEVSKRLFLVFPIHPRSKASFKDAGLLARLDAADAIALTSPMGYVRFMSLVSDSALLITDSGGVQEETTYLGIPCLTMRDNTERPITISDGTNRLVRPDGLAAAVELCLAGKKSDRPVLEFWDGHTATRVVASLKRHANT